MDLRSLIAKMDAIEEAAAAPAAASASPTNPWAPKPPDTSKQDAWAKLSPEQQKWLGQADPTDPAILARMRSAVPDAAPAPTPAPAPAPGPTPAPAPAPAQPSRAAQASDTSKQQLMAQLQSLMAKLPKQAVKEGFNLNEDNTVTLVRYDGSMVTFDPSTMKILNTHSSMASSLMESFGYDQYVSESDLVEYSWDQFKSDAGDTAQGAWQGATLGTGNNIAAGVKSAFGSGTYKQELAKQVAADKAAQERSPWLYRAGNVAGALAMPVPGGALAGGLIKGASTAAMVGRGAVQVGANLATQAAIDKGVNAANTKTLGYNPDAYPTTPQAIKAFQQANGLTADGIIGPKTKAVLDKLGLQPPTVQEQIALLSKKLAMLESDEQIDEMWSLPGGLSQWAGKAYNAAKNFATSPSVGKEVTNAAGDTFRWLGGQWAKVGASGAAGQMANKATAAELNAATRGVKNLPKNLATAALKNPGKTAGVAAGLGAGALALGGGGADPATTVAQTGGRTGGKTTPQGGATADAHGATTGATDPNADVIKQMQDVMMQLGQISEDDPAVAALLQQAQQAIDSAHGNAAQAAADVGTTTPAAAPTAPAPAADAGGDVNTLKVYGKDAADTAAKTAAARAAAAAPGTTTQ